jgi:hypothetical protein
VSASWLVPAYATSISLRLENTCSAVGLRKRFWLQTKRTFFTSSFCMMGRQSLFRNAPC